jgi:hypothetical protein
MQEDREIIGHSMNMTQDQIDYLSSLKRGFAAIYAEGDTRPKMVKMPLVRNKSTFERAHVIDAVKNNLNNTIGAYNVRYNHNYACSLCETRCEHRSTIDDWLRSGRLSASLVKAYAETLDKYEFDPGYISSCFNDLNVNRGLGKLALDQELCFIGELLRHSKMQESYKMQAIISYMKANLGQIIKDNVSYDAGVGLINSIQVL